MGEMNRRILIATTTIVGAAAAIFAATAQWRIAGVAVVVLLTVVGLFVISALSDVANARRDVAYLTELESAKSQPTKQISAAIKRQTREIEALLQLYGWVETDIPMPPSGPWAMNPEGILALFALVRRERPRVVLELGSGTSTVWIAYALAKNGSVGTNGSSGLGRLISIDHDAEYTELSREMVGQHVGNIAPTEIRHAALEPFEVGTEEFRWYSRDVLSDLAEIDLLIVDGPPSNTGPLSRYPAVGALSDRLSDGAIVVLDDATRGDERAVADRWISENEGMTRESSRTGRMAVFRYSAKK